MRAKIIKVHEQKSWLGQSFFYIFFKGADGRSYRTCAYPQFGNYPRWQKFIELHRTGREVWLDGLNTKGKNLIDADSYPQEVKP
ncbi:MAG: hypothetical protein PHP10_03680 [Candidatus Omnitrophica bacterium]|nr:hypothetical protein [Candidatus Omnitrophota bacterium]